MANESESTAPITTPGERAVIEPSLAEQATQRIEAQLLRDFSQPDAPEQVSVEALPVMLESSHVAITHAIWDLHLFQGITRGHLHNATRGGEDVSHRLSLTPDQVLVVNRHPFTRTLSGRELAVVLDASLTNIYEVAKQDDIEPIVRVRHEKLGGSHGFNRYSQDQVEKIREGLKRFHAPPGLIGEAAILASTGISPVALGDIQKRLKIRPRPFHNPELGHGEHFFTEQDVVKVLLFIHEHRKRHAPGPPST